jgi:hypothetical protein
MIGHKIKEYLVNSSMGYVKSTQVNCLKLWLQNRRCIQSLNYIQSHLGPVYTTVEKASGRSRMLGQDMVI